MFKRTAVPRAGPYEHQARRPLNMALDLMTTRAIHASLALLLALVPINVFSAEPLSPAWRERLHVEWNFGHSTDVVRAKVLAIHPYKLDGKLCTIRTATLIVTETFKGGKKNGQQFEAWGIEAHEHPQEETDHLLFMKMYEGSGHDACTSSVFATTLEIHNWCCALVQGANAASSDVLAYEMVNSEMKAPSRRLASAPVFDLLRQLQRTALKPPE